MNSQDPSGNNSTRILNTIINELLNGIDDDEIENPSIYNPFNNGFAPRRNYTIGRNIEQGSSLFNIVNQLFDTSNNPFNLRYSTNDNSENNENDENNQTDASNNPLIEEVTFHITYPINNEQTSIHQTASPETSSFNNVRNNLNNMLFRSYFSPVQTFPTNAFQRILSQSLYDESAYKKKISEKGKSQLLHIKFKKDDTENTNNSCPIMQTDFEEDDYIIRLPCNHNFTPFAINKWLDEKPECPVCRYELDYIEVKRSLETNITDNNNYNSIRNIRNNLNNSEHNDTNNEDESDEDNNNRTHNSNYRIYTSYYRNNRISTPSLNRYSNRNIHHRMNITPNSYLDYMYNEIDDQDFQQALILSYREIASVVDANNNTSDNIINSSNQDINEEEKNDNFSQDNINFSNSSLTCNYTDNSDDDTVTISTISNRECDEEDTTSTNLYEDDY